MNFQTNVSLFILLLIHHHQHSFLGSFSLIFFYLNTMNRLPSEWPMIFYVVCRQHSFYSNAHSMPKSPLQAINQPKKKFVIQRDILVYFKTWFHSKLISSDKIGNFFFLLIFKMLFPTWCVCVFFIHCCVTHLYVLAIAMSKSWVFNYYQVKLKLISRGDFAEIQSLSAWIDDAVEKSTYTLN